MPRLPGPMGKYDETFMLVSIGYTILSQIQGGKNTNAKIAAALQLDPPQVSNYVKRLLGLDLIEVREAAKFQSELIALTKRGSILLQYLGNLNFPRVHCDVEIILGRVSAPAGDVEAKAAEIVNELLSEEQLDNPILALWDLGKVIDQMKENNQRWYASTAIHEFMKEVPTSDLVPDNKVIALHLLRDAVVASRHDPEWLDSYDELTKDLLQLVGEEDEVAKAAFEILREFRDENGAIPPKIFQLYLDMIWESVTPGCDTNLHDPMHLVETLVAWMDDLGGDQASMIKKALACTSAANLEDYSKCIAGERSGSVREINASRLAALKNDVEQIIRFYPEIPAYLSHLHKS